ncbi:butyrophilin subfamily 3 member A2-like, partial [Mugil cephalus]|uniref:butyrophilin subfamily 3 member A2-like n=1 Tax=Mugil cephalus TaxID=48193 RepID=UPI001FB6C6CB
MCHQKTGPFLQSQFRVLLVYLLLHRFCRGQSQLIGSSQPITAVAGGDVILPCHLEPAQDVTTSTVEWSRSDLKPRFVHVLRVGQELMNIKNPSYNGRTLVLVEELKHGNISLKLSEVKPGDEGTYRCFIPEKTEEAFVELVVASVPVSSPVISLSGMDRDRGGVVLQCESRGWYPEPEVLWLDAEGNLLSAG